MTSNEALERYYSNLLYGNCGFQTDEEELEGLKAIKQDLDRLCQLEKENQELKLEKKILNGMYRDVRDTANFYMSKCEKFEKAIEILKSNLCIEFNDSYNGVSFKLDKYDECDYTILLLDDKQQYELLKEMLKYGQVDGL